MIEKKPPYVLLDACGQTKKESTSYFFCDFERILTFKSSDDPFEFFHKLQNCLDKGYWLSGYITYEMGYYLEPALSYLRKDYDFNLAWFGLARRPMSLGRDIFNSPRKAASKAGTIKKVKANIAESEYAQAIKKIKGYLEEGDTYQVNFTFKLKFDYEHHPWQLYQQLRKAQPTAYSAFINTGSEYILSHSPELFFKREGNSIITRPMKGTIARGLTWESDIAAQNLLKENTKTLAENIMIVDLLRNDLGRVSSRVWVSKLFEVERHPTLHQMTSTIQAKLKNNVSWKELFDSLFPSGSVTGAPKIRTMQIIGELEKEPRNIYTGAIGFLSPQKRACFNVAIRTILIKNKKGEMGLGGGIVCDSVAADEYKEALLKGSFLLNNTYGFGLIETMRFERGKGFYLLDLHLSRLEKSCKYFSIPFNRKKIIACLKKAVVSKTGLQKIKMLVDSLGKVSVEVSDLENLAAEVKVVVSEKKVSKDNIYLYHKTTQRHLYEQEYAWAKNQGCFEVIFLNKEQQLTEGSFTNIFIEKKGKWYTPSLNCGLLPGTLRQQLLQERKVFEKELYLQDLFAADAIYIGNSVRGLLRARLVGDFEKRRPSDTIYADEKYSKTIKA